MHVPKNIVDHWDASLERNSSGCHRCAAGVQGFEVDEARLLRSRGTRLDDTGQEAGAVHVADNSGSHSCAAIDSTVTGV